MGAKKTRISTIGFAIAVCVLAATLSFAAAQPDDSWQSVKPRTLVYLRSNYAGYGAADLAHALTWQETVQIREDGSVSKHVKPLHQKTNPDSADVVQNIFDRATKTRTIIGHGDGYDIKSSIALVPADQTAEMTARANRCGSGDEGRRFLGIEAFPVYRRAPSPYSVAHVWITTDWLAPEVNCMSVHRIEERRLKDDDGDTNFKGPEVVSSRVLLHVKDSIEAAAFTVPDFPEVPASEFTKRALRNRPDLLLEQAESMAEQDAGYYSHRP